MTAEKYTFPANYGGFDAVFREYRAIFEKQPSKSTIRTLSSMSDRQADAHA